LKSLHIIFGASEVAEYVYCKRAWWLRRVQEVSIPDSPKLHYGASMHSNHNNRVKYAIGVQYCGYFLIVIGVVAALLIFLGAVPLR
jgi:CRISPR/Cas system-associated exonuclease Cas4 (RecB family)